MAIDAKNTSKTLFKNTAIIAMGQLSTKLISFLLMPLYTALLIKEEYGLIDLLNTYTGLIVILVGMQVYQSLFRFIVTKRDNLQRVKSIITTSFVATIAALMIYTILFIAVSPLVKVGYKWYLLISVYSQLFMQLTTNAVRGLGNNKDYAIGSFISAFSTLILNVLGMTVLRLGILAMLMSSIIGSIIGGSYILFKNKLWCYINLNLFSKNELKRILRYALPLIPNELSWSVIHASDRMVVSNIISIAANGLIAVASRFSVIYTTFFSFFNTSWTEQVVLHYKDQGGPQYIASMFNKMVTFFASLTIGITACMPFVFDIMVDKSYSEAYGLVPIYLVAVFFNAVIGMISSIYLVHNETGKVALTTAVAAVINLVTDILLIKYIGIYAAPVSSVLGYLTISIWRLIDVNKRHCKITMPIRKVFLLVVLFAAVLAGYYSNNVLLQIILLLAIALITILMNKFMIISIFAMFKRKKQCVGD